MNVRYSVYNKLIASKRPFVPLQQLYKKVPTPALSIARKTREIKLTFDVTRSVTVVSPYVSLMAPL